LYIILAIEIFVFIILMSLWAESAQK
jgi:hypothetical protein